MMTSSILLSDLDRDFFLQNVHSRHSRLVRRNPSLRDFTPKHIVLAFSPRVVARTVNPRIIFTVIWVLLTAKPDFTAPARALKPKTIGDVLKGMRKVAFNPNGSMFDDSRGEGCYSKLEPSTEGVLLQELRRAHTAIDRRQDRRKAA